MFSKSNFRYQTISNNNRQNKNLPKKLENFLKPQGFRAGRFLARTNSLVQLKTPRIELCSAFLSRTHVRALLFTSGCRYLFDWLMARPLIAECALSPLSHQLVVCCAATTCLSFPCALLTTLRLDVFTGDRRRCSARSTHLSCGC